VVSKQPIATTETYQYHLDKYDPDVDYNEFIQDFTASCIRLQGMGWFIRRCRHTLLHPSQQTPRRVCYVTFPRMFQTGLQLQNTHIGTFFRGCLMHRTSINLTPQSHVLLPARMDPSRLQDFEPYLILDTSTSKIISQTSSSPRWTRSKMSAEILWCDIAGPNKTTELHQHSLIYSQNQTSKP
jgi:hypothetical protein